MANKEYNWNTTPVENIPNDSAWQEFVAGATKERIRKERKAELDKQKNENAKPKTPMTGSDWVKFVILVIISIAFILPILLVLMNSFKSDTYIKTETFAFPNSESFVGFSNYTEGIDKIFSNINIYYCVFGIKIEAAGVAGNIRNSSCKYKCIIFVNNGNVNIVKINVGCESLAV